MESDGSVLHKPELIRGDIFRHQADVLVVPCSTGGTIAPAFLRGLRETTTFRDESAPPMELGAIRVVDGFESMNYRRLVFAASVDNNNSHIGAIEHIAASLARVVGEYKMTSVIVPLLGTGSGGLDPRDVFSTLTSTFFAFYPEDFVPQLKVVAYDVTTYNLISETFADVLQGRNPKAKERKEFNLRTDGDRTILSRATSSQETPTDIPGATGDVQSDSNLFLNKVLSNDIWAEKDRLGYECYAKVISEMIKEESLHTKPPLTVAILAPWGQGKTTLMRYIERNIKKTREGLAAPDKVVPKKDLKTDKSSTTKDILNWIRHLPAMPGKLAYPTVWFNPWKHQNSEQIWAGLAQAIIGQLVEYLPREDQEKFWFHLNIKRVDVATLKNRIYKNIVSEFVQSAGVLIVLASLFIFFGLLALSYYVVSQVFHLNIFAQVINWFLAPVGLVLPSVLKYVQSRSKVLNENLKDKFADIVTEPDYHKRAGYFQEVERDMDRVFDILVAAEKPAIIFIDDLDRCSPDVVVEVIEAINLIINGNYKDKCYFVVGMDAKMVAASLAKKYEALSDKFQEEKSNFGDIGYYFLDKFIQLPFAIPVIKDEDRRSLLADLFNSDQPKEQALLREDEKEAIEAYVNTAGGTQSATQAEQLIRDNDEAKLVFIANKVRQTVQDSPQIVEQLSRFLPYLGSSPRSIKRFVNLYRFYYSYQELRKLEGRRFAAPATLARWVVISIRCPQLVRYLQWESEDRFINSSNPAEKADCLDAFIKNFKTEHAINASMKSDHKICGIWNGHVDKLAIPDFYWLKDKDILDILLLDDSEEGRFANALECNIW